MNKISGNGIQDWVWKQHLELVIKLENLIDKMNSDKDWLKKAADETAKRLLREYRDK